MEAPNGYFSASKSPLSVCFVGLRRRCGGPRPAADRRDGAVDGPVAGHARPSATAGSRSPADPGVAGPGPSAGVGEG